MWCAQSDSKLHCVCSAMTTRQAALARSIAQQNEFSELCTRKSPNDNFDMLNFDFAAESVHPTLRLCQKTPSAALAARTALR